MTRTEAVNGYARRVFNLQPCVIGVSLPCSPFVRIRAHNHRNRIFVFFLLVTSTAAIVRNGQIEVVGRSAVVVFGSRKAKVEKTQAGGVVAGTGVITSVLRQGMTLPLK